MFGLFSPLHKVQKYDGNTIPSTNPTPSSVIPPPPSSLSKTARATGGIPLLHRADSSESINSVASSVMSSASKSTRRAGAIPSAVMSSSAYKQPVERRMSGQVETLQKALKEKEEHVDQLLKEISLLRDDNAKACQRSENLSLALAQKASEIEQTAFDSNEQVLQLNATVTKLEADKAHAITALEDEKKKVEDLQFQLEEQSLTTDEIKDKSVSLDSEAMNTLHNNLNVANEKISNLENELSRLKMENDAKVDRISSVTSELENLKVAISEKDNVIVGLTAQQSGSQGEVGKLAAELNEFKVKLEEANANLTSAKTKENELTNEIGQLKKQIIDTENGCKNKTSELDAVKSTMTELESAISSSKGEIERLQSLLSDSEAALRRSSQSEDAAMKDMENQLKSQAEELRSVKSKLVQNDEEFKQREGKLNELNNQLNEKVQTLESSIKQVEQDNSSKDAALKSLEEQRQKEIDVIKTDITTLKGINAKLEKDNSDLINVKTSLEKELEQSKAALNGAQNDSASLKGNEEKLSSEVQRLQECVDKSQKLIEDLQAKEQVLQMTCDEISKKCHKSEMELKSKTEEKAEVERLLAEKEAESAKREKIEPILENLKTQVATLQNSYEDQVKKTQEVIAREGALKTASDGYLEKISTLECEINALKSSDDSKAMQKSQELDKMQMEYESVKKQLEEKLKLEADLVAQNEATVLKLVDAESQLETQKQELVVLKNSMATMQSNQQDESNAEKLKLETELSQVRVNNEQLKTQIASLEAQLSELKSRYVTLLRTQTNSCTVVLFNIFFLF